MDYRTMIGLHVPLHDEEVAIWVFAEGYGGLIAHDVLDVVRELVLDVQGLVVGDVAVPILG